MHKRRISSTLAISLIIVSSSLVYQPVLGTLAGNMSASNLKNNATVIIKGLGSGDNTPTIISAITAAGGIATILIGLKSYQQNQKQNRIVKEKDRTKDIVFPLINEFDNAKKLQMAKKLLDGINLRVEDHDKKRYQYVNKYYPSGWHSYDTLDPILRDHKIMDVYADGELRIRCSFDAFLDFLSKLEYLCSIDLMSDNELNDTELAMDCYCHCL